MELRLRRTLWAVLVAGFSMMSFTAAGETQFTIGTGGVAGVYHQIGAAVCRFLRKSHEGHDLRCRTLDLPRFSGELFAHSRPAISNWTGLL